MHIIRVNRTDLLAKLIANRADHREIVDEALTKYREEAIKELDSMIADAMDGRRIRRSLTLIEPMDQTREYDAAIEQLNMSVDAIIELTETEFNQFVLNRWRWTNQMLVANSSYSAKTAALLPFDS